MARQQSFPSHRRQGFQGSQESQRDQEQPFRSEEADWRGGRPRGDYFNAMEDRGYAAQSSWDEDRYGYPEATRYGREMNRSQRGYGPEGRFAQDPYEQQRGTAWAVARAGRRTRADAAARTGAAAHPADSTAAATLRATIHRTSATPAAAPAPGAEARNPGTGSRVTGAARARPSARSAASPAATTATASARNSASSARRPKATRAPTSASVTMSASTCTATTTSMWPTSASRSKAAQ